MREVAEISAVARKEDEEGAGAGQRGDEIALQPRELVEAVHEKRRLEGACPGVCRGGAERGCVVGETLELPCHIGMERPERFEHDAPLRGTLRVRAGPASERLGRDPGVPKVPQRRLDSACESDAVPHGAEAVRFRHTRNGRRDGGKEQRRRRRPARHVSGGLPREVEERREPEVGVAPPFRPRRAPAGVAAAQVDAEQVRRHDDLHFREGVAFLQSLDRFEESALERGERPGDESVTGHDPQSLGEGADKRRPSRSEALHIIAANGEAVGCSKDAPRRRPGGSRSLRRIRVASRSAAASPPDLV